MCPKRCERIVRNAGYPASNGSPEQLFYHVEEHWPNTALCAGKRIALRRSERQMSFPLVASGCRFGSYQALVCVAGSQLHCTHCTFDFLCKAIDILLKSESKELTPKLRQSAFQGLGNHNRLLFNNVHGHLRRQQVAPLTESGPGLCLDSCTQILVETSNKRGAMTFVGPRRSCPHDWVKSHRFFRGSDPDHLRFGFTDMCSKVYRTIQSR